MFGGPGEGVGLAVGSGLGGEWPEIRPQARARHRVPRLRGWEGVWLDPWRTRKPSRGANQAGCVGTLVFEHAVECA